MGKTILILGGGTAGVAAANVLADVLPPGNHLTLVDRSPVHLFFASLPLLLVGRRKPGQLTRELSRLESRGLKFIQTEVEGLDLVGKTVLTKAGKLPYDALLIALGAERNEGLIPGQKEWAFNPYSLEETGQLSAKLARFPGGRIALFIADLPFTGAVAPYEIVLLLHDYFRRRGLRRQVEIVLITPEQRPFSFAPPKISTAVAELLAQAGIKLLTGHSVTRITKTGELFLDRGELTADLILAIPSHEAPPCLRSSPLAGPGGWLEVDPHSLETAWEAVYALGDVTGIQTSTGHWLPKVGFFAHYQAEVAARNLALKLSGKEPSFKFRGGAAGASMLTAFRRGCFVSLSAYAIPPAMTLSPPNTLAYLTKTIFEKYWLTAWF
ncbi:MAG: FAD-dependent oxidoreductase [Bacillota bacterium]|nr:FAD-dependent oxidoreductase [Bacillota bacterium]